jgi:hypothetical protein
MKRVIGDVTRREELGMLHEEMNRGCYTKRGIGDVTRREE